ncbi:MAG TPA: hypothetical protein VJ969_10985 [Desulfopila sp.]|nr:hypothetical protein [Desulfopila sp.]
MNIHTFMGSEGATILWWQMCIRALAIFLVVWLLVRMGKNRIYGKFGSLVIVLAVILGSILSRTLTANAPFLATTTAAFTLVAVHNLMIKAAFRRRFPADNSPQITGRSAKIFRLKQTLLSRPASISRWLYRCL